MPSSPQSPRTPRKPQKPRVAKYRPTDADRAKVKLMAALGNRECDIALIMDISEPTLRTHYKRELAIGHVEANTVVQKTAYQMATSGSVPAMTMFWLKTRCGWRETNKLEVTGKDDGPLMSGVLAVPVPLDSDQWTARASAQQADLLAHGVPAGVPAGVTTSADA